MKVEFESGVSAVLPLRGYEFGMSSRLRDVYSAVIGCGTLRPEETNRDYSPV